MISNRTTNDFGLITNLEIGKLFFNEQSDEYKLFCSMIEQHPQPNYDIKTKVYSVLALFKFLTENKIDSHIDAKKLTSNDEDITQHYQTV